VSDSVRSANGSEVASCSYYCGARGRLEYTIDDSAKRKIRYMDKLKTSREYAEAVQNLQKTGEK
jgi:hypothetical protein